MVIVNRVVNRIVRLLRLQRFRGAQILYLTTVGRKTGKVRTVPLAFVRDGDDYVVAASNGGSDWQPGWWLNLQAQPQATIRVGDADVAITASAVADTDRTELWRRLSDQLDAYDGYQQKVSRRIDLVRLRPLGSA
jgi:deazaflavin-dependent oxidoreductase (nitroreductase family)